MGASYRSIEKVKPHICSVFTVIWHCVRHSVVKRAIQQQFVACILEGIPFTDSKRKYRRIVNKRDRWESRHGKATRRRSTTLDSPASKRRSRRSVSEERLIEMLVVADKTMVDFYNANDHGGVEKYVLTIVNMVRAQQK